MSRVVFGLFVGASLLTLGVSGRADAADPAAPAPAPAAPAPAAPPVVYPQGYPPGYPQGYPVYTYPPGYPAPGYPQAPTGTMQPVAPYAVAAPPAEAAPTPLPPTCKAVIFGTAKEVEKVMGEMYATGRTQFAFFGNGLVCGWK